MHNGYFRSLRAVSISTTRANLKPRCVEDFVAEAEALTRDYWSLSEMVANETRVSWVVCA